MSGIASDDKTHVRIINGVAELITWQEASDEVNAAQMGPKRRQLVRTMSSDDNGRTHHIDYYDGRKVTVRDATDADQPAASVPIEQPQERHVTPFAGGKVHLDTPGLRYDFPLCRTGAMTNSGTKYRQTDAPVDCVHCTEQLRRQAARLEREAAKNS
ncbi:hypothetical protein [Streptacidiphilus sp. MAP5-3]|uniref:hypothetical protein n=1 Tax=unclassified Streptacidiphilus TaxID=2643834 RepID=UPI003515CA62